ncbi:TIGR04282 family arsenosugar biosynthesis glycosyltransferase [Muriicola sp.]|uniref:TIGR04282 family arsenosugar biosynthesis glycosyltransferase n=1 Tax=Muriicola sp. TaxID=2020856 RepID=UPI003C742456
MKQKTAILVFANSSKVDERLKGIRNGAILFEELTRKTLAMVKRTGIPFYHFTEQEQNGASFAERFVGCIEKVFALGYEQVITLGNDSPKITFKDLSFTAKELSPNTMVLGPSWDGGFYLMGIHRDQFNKNEFLALPWQTPQLLQELRTKSNTKIFSIFYLKTLMDLDTSQDLILFAKRSFRLFSGIVRLIQSVLFSKLQVFYQLLPNPSSIVVSFSYNKGSPSLLLISPSADNCSFLIT